VCSSDLALADDDLAPFVELKHLESLVVRRGRLSDAAVRHLRRMPKLARLGLLEVGLTDRGLEQLAEINRLEMLDLRGCANISNGGLKHLAALGNLKTLRLGGQRIDDRSLEICGTLPALTIIAVDEAAVTKAGLERLAALPLEELSLFRCYSIDDDALAALARLKKLRRLSLRGIPIGGEGLSHLSGLEALSDLRLNETGVDDQAIKHLLNLKKTLRRLELRQTLIGDAAVDRLARLDNLRYLDVGETNISAEAARRLHSALPKCEIVR
jgi:hypothetical protein